MTNPLNARFDSADDSPGFLLWQVANLWQRRQRAALEPLGLTHVQFVLLASMVWLTSSGEPLPQAALAEHAHTDVMMTSEVLRALERRGLVERRPHPHDSRARAVAPTPAGRAAAQEAVAVVEGVDRQFFGTLGDDGAALAALLRQLRRPL
jgi:DNA-binding MarR family transcriptional regulator